MRIVLKTQDRKQELADFAWTMAQVPTATGSPLQIADVSAVDLFVYDKNSATPSVPIYSSGLPIPMLSGNGGVISNTLRRNGDGLTPEVPWSENNTGCNFAHYLYQGTVFPGGPTDPVEAGGHTYRLEYRIKTFTAGTMWVVRESTTSGIISTGGGGSGPPPPMPDFNLSVVSASSQVIQQGAEILFTFGITPVNGFIDDVTFAISDVQPPIVDVYNFIPNPVTGGTGQTDLHIQTSPLTVPGLYQITVVATSGSLFHATNVTLQVNSIGGGGTGWTDFTLNSTDRPARAIYLAAAGSDANDGLTPITPKRTLDAGRQMMRNGYGDWLLLHCGDTFNGHFGQWSSWGRSNTDKQLIGSYVYPAGGSTARPIVDPGTENGIFFTNNGTNLAVTTATWNEATKTLTFPVGSLVDYPTDFGWAGRKVNVTAGAGVIPGTYRIASGSTLTRQLVLTTSIGAGATTNIAANHTIYANDIAIVGIHFYAGSNLDGAVDIVGINWLGQSENALIEDCKFEQFSGNVNIQRTPDPPSGEESLPDGSWHTNFVFRRNVICDAHAGLTLSINAGQGIFVAFAQSVVVEENVFEHNGWRADMRGSYQGFNKHNMYLHNATRNATVRGNVVTNADMQMRGGGICENNLYLDNYIAFQFGIGTYSQFDPAGVTGTIQGNVMIGSSNIGDCLVINAATWNEATLTLTVTDPPNPWARFVNNSQVGMPAAAGSEEGNSINFHCAGGTGVVADDPAHPMAGRRIVSNTANTLTLNRTIGAGANGHNDIFGWTTYGQTQGPRGIFMYAGNISGANVQNNIIANNMIAGGPEAPGHSAKVFDLEAGHVGGGGSHIGCNNMTFVGNKIFNWASNLSGPAGFVGGGTCWNVTQNQTDSPTPYSGNLLGTSTAGNEVQNLVTTEPLTHNEHSNVMSGFTGANNHFFSIAGGTSWFDIPPVSDLPTWRAALTPPDPSSSSQRTTYANESATIATFMQANGLGLTHADYIAAIRNLSRASGDAAWQALMPTWGAGIINPNGPLAYFRTAFS